MKLKRKTKKTIFNLFIVLIFAIAAVFFGPDLIEDLLKDDLPGEYERLPLEEYYEGADGLEGDELAGFLTELISTDVIGVNYGDARGALAEADVHPEDSSKVLTIYSREAVDREWDGSSWHREHVWPNSRLGIDRVGNSTINQGTDLHNLRAIVPRVNSSRGNKIFDEETDSISYFPGDDDKGDVARILFYMHIRYADILDLVEVVDDNSETSYTPEGAQMGRLSVLLRWHREDPVDNFERNRNEVIYKWQNNRNPFIDHPEFVHLIYEYEDSNNEKTT